MSETVEITRYPNRRLYDRNRKKYVTLGDVEAMVLGGQNVRVRDSKSDEDLTRVILTQIILERHPERMKMFPLPFLHTILRADQLALDWLTVYFGQAMTFLERITRSSGTRFVPGVDFWQKLRPDQPKPQVDEGSPTDEEVDEQALSAKLAEMEQRLQQLESQSSDSAESGSQES